MDWRKMLADRVAIGNTSLDPSHGGVGVQVTSPARGERSFHVFYMFLRGLAIAAPSTAAALRLRSPVEYRYLGGTGGAGEVPDAAARAAMEAASEAATAHEGGRTDAEQVPPLHTHRLSHGSPSTPSRNAQL
jgi:hypothetical protein